MKINDVVVYKGKQYKILFDYKNGHYEIISPDVPQCLLVKLTDITKV